MKEVVKGRERAVAEGGRRREGGEREGRLGGEGKDRDREGQAGNVGRRGERGWGGREGGRIETERVKLVMLGVEEREAGVEGREEG